jgi:hypothetical protein
VILPSSVENGSREVVVTFEDLRNDKPMGPIPAGYAGFTWSGSAWFLTKGCYSSVCMRDQVALFCAYGHDVSFERQGSFHLKSLSLSALWEDIAEVVLEGWENGVRKYSQTLTVFKNTATEFTVDYRGINRVSFKTGGAHIVVDNIALHLD